MTKQEIKTEIKRILKVSLTSEVMKGRKDVVCEFCGWKPRNYGWGIHPASLLSHLSYKHPGTFKTRVDLLYDFFESLYRKEDCLCEVTLESVSTTRKQKKT